MYVLYFWLFLLLFNGTHGNQTLWLFFPFMLPLLVASQILLIFNFLSVQFLWLGHKLTHFSLLNPLLWYFLYNIPSLIVLFTDSLFCGKIFIPILDEWNKKMFQDLRLLLTGISEPRVLWYVLNVHLFF